MIMQTRRFVLRDSFIYGKEVEGSTHVEPLLNLILSDHFAGLKIENVIFNIWLLWLHVKLIILGLMILGCETILLSNSFAFVYKESLCSRFLSPVGESNDKMIYFNKTKMNFYFHLIKWIFVNH